ALPNYLSALENFNDGNVEQALAEIKAANQKPGYSSFDLDRRQSREEMFLLSGYSPVEAKQKGVESIESSSLARMKALAVKLSELQQSYQAAGDENSANQTAAMTIQAAHQLERGSSTTVADMVQYAMENITLRNLDANTYYDFLGKTAGERMQELKDKRKESHDLIKATQFSYYGLTDSEKLIYWDRLKLYGELNTMKWLQQNYGTVKP
ncbi:MAG: hypothetical protein M3Y82_00895, partial [Verrucomicrobiota bacterium]|nr:hypothetical protein [Verrucomicrobiota bacterium]